MTKVMVDLAPTGTFGTRNCQPTLHSDPLFGVRRDPRLLTDFGGHRFGVLSFFRIRKTFG